MSRRDEVSSISDNPSKYFIKWSSDDKCFTYYNKDKQEDVLIHLPFKFTWLKSMVKIGGFNEASNSGITSNEVSPYDLKKEELEVKSFKGGVIAKGFYGDIKDAVNGAGGKYGTSAYVMLSNGEVANIHFIGASQGSWYDFSKDHSKVLPDNYVEIASSVEGKKGRTVFNSPVITLGGTIVDADIKKADEAYKVVKESINGVPPRVVEANAASVPHTEPQVEDDLPF